jgi:hypothetical protein
MEITSSLHNVNELLRLMYGDKNRLEELKLRIENGRTLYISDNNYLKKLVNKHQGEFQKYIESEKIQKTINVSIAAKDLINLGIDVWRMEQRLNKIMQTIPEKSQDLLKNSIQKIKRYLDKNNIEIIDYTNQKFNEGRNLDILAVEKSSNILESIIKETKEPTILHKNQVVNKGKVIILEKNTEDLSHE